MEKLLAKVWLLLMLVIFCRHTCNAGTEKLVEVNAEWKNHAQLLSTIAIDKTPTTETAWIQLHLTLVEQHIRGSIATSGLTKQQQQRKHAALDELRLYIAKAEFPINEQYNYRTPIFIDAYNNFCAVGYLLKQTGQEELARKISKDDNLVYVRKIKSDALMAWASEYGFSVDELAWIQPTYNKMPTTFLSIIGGGVNDEVKTMYVDSVKAHLYVGGNFETANFNFLAWGIGRYNLETQSWDSITYGADGSLNKIINYRDTLFLGGDFEGFRMKGSWTCHNVAMVINDTIQSCGVVDGTILDMIEYKGNLYAAGNFTSGNAKNIGRWNGRSWDTLTGGTIDGTINTLTIHDNKLVLGGEFRLQEDTLIKNIIAYSDSCFSSLGALFPYKVNDVVSDNGNLLVVTDAFVDGDTSGLWMLNTGLWNLVLKGSDYSEKYGAHTRFNSFHYDMWGKLYVSGLFNIAVSHNGSGAGTTYIGTNLMTIKSGTDQDTRGKATLDGMVNSFVHYKNRDIIGGSFARNSASGFTFVTLNGLAYFDETAPTGIDEANELEIGLYPNPASASITITLPAADNSATASIYNVQGQWVQSHTLTAAANTLQLGDMPAGIYVVQVVSGNDTGQKRLVKY